MWKARATGQLPRLAEIASERPTQDRPTERVKVAILGGGCGGLAAAWRADCDRRAPPAFRGDRLSTRLAARWQGSKRPDPARHLRAERGQRIEEHGLHIWFGFYEHAFRMLRGAYEEAGLAAGENWWTVPFEKCDSICRCTSSAQMTPGRGRSINLPRRGGSESWPADRTATPAPRARDRAHDQSARDRPADASSVSRDGGAAGQPTTQRLGVGRGRVDPRSARR